MPLKVPAPSGFDSTTLIAKKPIPTAVHHPIRIQSPEPAGAAQFITNLNERQQAHLQYAIPSNSEPERFSQFLEGPRRTPVPDRFTFDALGSEVRSLRENTKIPVQGGRSETPKGVGRSKLNAVDGNHGQDDRKSEKMSRSGKRSQRSSNLSFADNMKRTSTGAFEPVDGMPEPEKLDWRFYVTAVCLLLINLVIAWDVVVISIALPTISFALHGSAIQALWIGISFLVAATTFLPFFSAFADIFGRKTVLLASLMAFSAGSFIAAVAGNMNILHLGRSIQGIGAGGLYLLSDLVASDLESPLDKRRLNTALGAIWAIGALTGPVIGEALGKIDQWRWIFWINLPFCISATVVLAFFAKLKGATPGSIGPKLRKFDWFGFVLLGGSLVSLLLGLSWGGSLYSWGHTNTLLPIQFGFIGLIVYCVWSKYSPFQSVISLEGFTDRTSLGTYLGTTVQGAIIGAFIYFMPFYFTVAKVELMSLKAGVRWLPWMLPFIILVLTTFIVVSRWNMWLPAIWLGWILVLVGVSLTTLYSRTSSNATWVCIAMIAGSGVGILYPSLHTASELIAANNESRARHSITNYTFFHFLGKTFGVAMATSIFQNGLLKNLSNNPIFAEFATKYTNDSVATVAKILVTPGGPGTPKEQIMDIYVKSLKSIWIALAVLAAVALVSSFFMMPKESQVEQEVEMDPSYTV